MAELLQYVRTLKDRGFAVSYRELRSRFIRESPVVSVNRILDLFEQHQAIFTFFVVGVCAADNKNIIQYIIERGHEIGCHGFYHHRFDLMRKEDIAQDLEKAKNFFWQNFKYELKGFRAPYLMINSDVYSVLKQLGFTYSSSVYKGDEYHHDSHGIIELPVYADDWDVLIRRNLGRKGLYEEMKSVDYRRNNCVFLLHPWRVGQKKYIPSIVEFLELRNDTGFISMYNMAQGEQGIAITGDVGEFSLKEIMKRMI